MATTTELKINRNLKSVSDNRYKRCGIIVSEVDGREYFETFESNDVKFSENDVYHEVDPGEAGRLDLISYRNYNTPAYWWLIAEANNIVFPMRDVYPGAVLRIPPIDAI